MSDNYKLEWDKLQTDLRRTMSVLVLRPRGSPMPEGITMAYERLARSIRLGGGKSPARSWDCSETMCSRIPKIASNRWPGWHWNWRPSARRAEPNEGTGGTSERAGGLRRPRPSSSRCTSCWNCRCRRRPARRRRTTSEYPLGLCGRPRARRNRPGTQHRPPAGAIRRSFCCDRAGRGVRRSGGSEPGFRRVSTCWRMSSGKRDLPDWPLIRLAQTIGRAPLIGGRRQLFAFLQKQEGLSPRSQAVRAWRNTSFCGAGLRRSARRLSRP